MKDFIANLENYFKQDWQTVFDKAITGQLSPHDIIEIWYLYSDFVANSPISRDHIMYNLADMKLADITLHLSNIKNEILEYLPS